MKPGSTNLNNVYYLLASYLVVIGVMFYASFESLLVMEGMWSTKEEYGYAYMIPLIVGYFIWQRLYKLEKVKFELSNLGFVAFVGSLFVILLGVLSATHSITQYGFIISLIAALYMFMGIAVLRIVIAPMLILFVIVPLPAFLFNNLSGYLQLLSSELGVWVIRLFGISVYLEGNVIDLGIYKLQVVEACSGLRYLFPLFSLSLIAAFIFNAALWKRTILVLSSLPITVLMNSFRIGVIGILVEYWGVELAEGFLHDFEGWIVFMGCTALLVIEMWLLLKIGTNKKTFSDAFTIDLPDYSDLKFKGVPPGKKYFAITIIAISLGIFISLVNERAETSPERENFSTFPLAINDWTGRRGSIEDSTLDVLKLDDYFIANYINEKGKIVNFYAAYYNTQKSGQAAHSPKSCIPGGGWKINNFSTRSLTIRATNENKTVNRLFIAKGEYAQLVYYWFPQRGRIITNEYMVKWFLFWDAMTRNRTDGALVRLTTVITPGVDISKADERIVNFINQIEPLMSKYLPN